jgi:hypothetical protein
MILVNFPMTNNSLGLGRNSVEIGPYCGGYLSKHLNYHFEASNLTKSVAFADTAPRSLRSLQRHPTGLDCPPWPSVRAFLQGVYGAAPSNNISNLTIPEHDAANDSANISQSRFLLGS